MNTTIESIIKNAFRQGMQESSDEHLGNANIHRADVDGLIAQAQALLSQGKPVHQRPVNGLWRDMTTAEWDKQNNRGTTQGLRTLYATPPSIESLQKDNAELFGKTEQLNKDMAELIEYAKKLCEAIEAMATNGWMYCGVEGLDESQQKVLNALETPQPICMTQGE